MIINYGKRVWQKKLPLLGCVQLMAVELTSEVDFMYEQSFQTTASN